MVCFEFFCFIVWKWWFSCANAHSVDNSAGFILVSGRSSPVEAGGSPQPLWILWGSSKNSGGISLQCCTTELCVWADPLILLAPQEDIWEAGGQGSRRLLLWWLGAETTLCHHCCIRPTSHQPISWGLMQQLPQTHPLPLQRCQGTEISTMIQ